MELTRTLPLPRSRAPRLPGLRPRRSSGPARERNQRANVNEDAATYSCRCGYVFKAAVTTSVGCPHCGTDQAW
jgi:rubrerythrin